MNKTDYVYLWWLCAKYVTGSSVKGPRPARPDAKLPDALDGRRLDGLVAGKAQVVVRGHVEASDATDRHVLARLTEGGSGRVKFIVFQI